MDRLTQKLHHVCEELLKKRQQSHSLGVAKDYVDSYVEQLESVTDPNSSFYGETGSKRFF